MPAVGLAVPAEHVRAALEQVELLRAAGRRIWWPGSMPARATMPGWCRTMASSPTVGQSWCSRSCCLAWTRPVPTDDPGVLQRDLRYVQGQVERVGVRPARVAVSPACDLKCTLPGSVWPKAPDWAPLAPRRGPRSQASRRRRHVQLLHRAQPQAPAAGLFDFVGHSICPWSMPRRPLADRGAGGVAAHLGQHARLRRRQALLAVPEPQSRCAPTPTAPPRPRTAAGPGRHGPGDPREGALIGPPGTPAGSRTRAAPGSIAVTLGAVAGPSGPRPRVQVSSRGAAELPRGARACGVAWCGGPGAQSRHRATVQAWPCARAEGSQLWLSNLTGTTSWLRCSWKAVPPC